MKAIEVTFGRVGVRAIGTTPPFSAISGASSLLLSQASCSLPYSALIASPTFFCLKASSGYLSSLAAAKTGVACSTALPRPISATRPAPFRIRRRVANGPNEAVMCLSKRESEGLQEIDDGADFLLGQDAVAPEWRHHRRRIADRLVVEDRDQLGTVVLGLEIFELRADRARQVAALDLMAGQAIALAAVEGELLAIGGAGLGLCSRGCDEPQPRRQGGKACGLKQG